MLLNSIYLLYRPPPPPISNKCNQIIIQNFKIYIDVDSAVETE